MQEIYHRLLPGRNMHTFLSCGSVLCSVWHLFLLARVSDFIYFSGVCFHEPEGSGPFLSRVCTSVCSTAKVILPKRPDS
jgi:hypothetical protein